MRFTLFPLLLSRKYILAILCILFTSSQAFTSTAISTISPDTRVLFRENVSTFANDGSVEWTPFEIFQMCNRFKMCGVDTVSDSTFVVDLQSIWNWSNQHLVRGAVSHHVATNVKTFSVPFLITGSLPQPTTFSFQNFGPESFIDRLENTNTTSEVAFARTVKRLGICRSEQLAASALNGFQYPRSSHTVRLSRMGYELL